MEFSFLERNYIGTKLFTDPLDFNMKQGHRFSKHLSLMNDRKGGHMFFHQDHSENFHYGMAFSNKNIFPQSKITISGHKKTFILDKIIVSQDKLLNPPSKLINRIGLNSTRVRELLPIIASGQFQSPYVSININNRQAVQPFSPQLKNFGIPCLNKDVDLYNYYKQNTSEAVREGEFRRYQNILNRFTQKYVGRTYEQNDKGVFLLSIKSPLKLPVFKAKNSAEYVQRFRDNLSKNRVEIIVHSEVENYRGPHGGDDDDQTS